MRVGFFFLFCWKEYKERKRHGQGEKRQPSVPQSYQCAVFKVLDRHNIRIEIWDRAGYTLVSDSSSAAAAVARKPRVLRPTITVNMPGSQIHIAIDQNFGIIMTGR